MRPAYAVEAHAARIALAWCFPAIDRGCHGVLSRRPGRAQSVRWRMLPVFAPFRQVKPRPSGLGAPRELAQAFGDAAGIG